MRIGPNVVVLPVENRVEFGDAAGVVGFLKRQVSARNRLAAPLAGQPGGGGGEGAVERLDFSDVAALFAQFYAFVHRARTVFGNEACGLFGLRMKDGEADVRIAEADLRDQCPRFGVEAAGVEGDDGNRQVGGGDSVGNDHVFRRQAGGKNGLGEALRDLSEALVEQADFFGQSGQRGLVGRRHLPKFRFHGGGIIVFGIADIVPSIALPAKERFFICL